MRFHTGLDIGSTTAKVVVLDEDKEMVYSEYTRHFSDVKKTIKEVIGRLYDKFKDESTTISITGSGGLEIHKLLDVSFVQEVIANTKAIQTLIPETDVAIELGGEDSKITYLKGAIEQRMNSICAGGTGAFIDQMAALLETDAEGLNEMAKDATQVYPIASRCGVFAKTDIQALINQGAKKADLALSVFQSVVNQTISNLAQGRPIRGNVAFLGGPLYFSDTLRDRFIKTLDLSDDQVLMTDHPQLSVATGAALSSLETDPVTFEDLYRKINGSEKSVAKKTGRLSPLFSSEEEYQEFVKRHNSKEIPKKSLKGYKGPLYLGIDAGSTTSKIILLDEDLNIRYDYYNNNKGQPLDVVVDQVKEIYKNMEPGAYIKSSGITGYGEDFIKAALNIDEGEVETMAHLRAAQYFEPDVDYIIDIGGQDMKAIEIEDGVINSVKLNEACSSGCGSFLETFAEGINMSVSDFTKEAILAKEPVDLGSRCTVFMNSMVKQAQKEGAEIGDIAAGLAYSIIANAVQKVIRVNDATELGDKIVVQGGTFQGDAILRAFELETKSKVTRPTIAGQMGAFGMALIAKERSKTDQVSTLMAYEDLNEFSYSVKDATCRQCSNNCKLKINTFTNGGRYITGNRCERGSGVVRKEGSEIPNLYDYKYKRVFDYDSLPIDEAPRGEIGLLRVLNMYENYPFWHIFFTHLGYRVVLSNESTRDVYERGIESIASETACYPAKISHGHLEQLIDDGIKTIFYPGVFYEEKEYESAYNTVNCPVVTGYTDVLKNNVESIEDNNVNYINPFISLDNRKDLVKRLAETFEDIDKKDIKEAVRLAYLEQERYREDVINQGKLALDYIDQNDSKAIVLAGRPYHIDPEINHGISEMIQAMGLAVISEDAIAFESDISGRLRVLDQWTYHSRLYRAAEFVGRSKNLEMVQLNSFGCGIDAVTTDQVDEILKAYGKIYTHIKIDEVSNLGAIKIRIRSLLEASDRRKPSKTQSIESKEPLSFTKEMSKSGYTILVPQMAPIHFEILEQALRTENINMEILPSTDEHVVNKGLKYVHNDACYPTMFVVGQFIDALESGKYDNDKLALLMTQTGGACRASNYVGFIRKAIENAGYGHVPVIGISVQGIEVHPGLFDGANIVKALLKSLHAILYGDLIQRLSNATRPYEVFEGSTDLLTKKWIQKASDASISMKRSEFKQNVQQMVKDYENIEITNEKKPRVGIVGEILVKYLPAANNFLGKVIEEEGGEVVSGDLMDFLYYCFKNTTIKNQKLGKGKMPSIISEVTIKYINTYRKIVGDALADTRFIPLSDIEEIMSYASDYVSLGNQYGEGWLLTGEMIDLINHGAPNIVCVQPFGCLPNHIVGKGVMKSVRDDYDLANIIAIDYDASASETNQRNRIKLMMTRAKESVQEARDYSDKIQADKSNQSKDKKVASFLSL